MSYSGLKLFTGFATAALVAWKLTVIKAITIVVSAADINPPSNIISVSKALQPFINTNHATGKAINHAINTSFAKSFESIVRILFTLAPEPARLIS